MQGRSPQGRTFLCRWDERAVHGGGMTTELGLARERSDGLGEPLPRTVARVDIRPGSDPEGDRSSRGAAHELALRSIQQTVRSDDRVCPYGLSRIAIAFGSDAAAVTPRILGERLARAVGQGVVTDGRARRAEGGRGRQRAGKGEPSAATANRSDKRGPGRLATVPSTMVVTVDRLLTDVSGRSAMSTGALSSIGQPLPYGQFVSMPVLRHRTVVRYSTCRLAGYGTRHDDNLPEPGGADTLGTVLVVDPGPAGNGTPCLSALAACSLAQRLGFTSAVISLTPDDYPILDIAGDQVDLVVLVVGVEPTNGPSNWSSSTWSIPARVAGAYRSLGVDVLAVGAGAGAGALAACVEQGASALPDIDGLTEELRSMFGEQGGAASAKEDLRRIPARFEALMQLTASERRVLYFLTKGISAQDIATELVVSLATVRSHIRSILRKLGVRSQLAAVAMANGRDLEDAVGIETPKPLACP